MFYILHEEDYQLNGKSLTQYEAVKLLNPLKQCEEYNFLKEVDSIALRISIENLYKSYNNFYKKKGGKPHLKSKKRQRNLSYTTQMINNNIKIGKNYIILPKMGKVKANLHTFAKGKIKYATLKKTKSGKYFITLTCETEVQPKPVNDSQIGIDLGVHSFIITSEGDKYEAIQPLRKLEKKIIREQRKLSRKQKGSSNYEKQRIVLAKLHEKVANIRKYQQDKLSTFLINKYGAIFIEDLDIRAMVHNPYYAKQNLDASWRQFVNMLEYKALWYGRTLVKVDTFYPSSQLCHNCGYKNIKVKDPKIREWTCPECGASHDRDINAALNILIEGQKLLKTA